MRDVIQKVIATEAEARRIVEAARAEAVRISAGAQKQGEELVARTRQEARAEADRVVEAALKTAAQEKRERLARAVAEIDTQVQLDETARQRAVAAAIRCVCGQR